jgi:hypothetical protein
MCKTLLGEIERTRLGRLLLLEMRDVEAKCT